MELKNGYKVIYEAKDLVSEEKPGPVYASKILQRADGKMLTSLKCKDSSYVDLKEFKLIYSDGANLIGSVEKIPTAEDIKFYIVDEDGVIVYGEGPDVPPTTKYRLTVNDVENCVVTGAGEYDDRTIVEVTVAPAEGYKFADGAIPKANGYAMTPEMGYYSYEFDIDGHDVDVEITDANVVPENTEEEPEA